MSTLLYATLGLYFISLLSIGVYFYFRTEVSRLEDYMLAKRDVAPIPMAISEAASIASGFTFFAFVGIGYTLGLSGIWLGISAVFIYLFVYRFIGPKLRQDSENLDSYTIVDHLSVAVDNKKYGRWIRGVGALTIIVFMTSYVGAQIIAVGEALDTSVGLNYTLAIVLGGALVAIYVTLGGFNASIWTDVVQGLLVIIGVVVLPIIMIFRIGGFSSFIAEAQAIDPTLISGNPGLGPMDFLVFLLAWYAFGLGSIGQPHGMMRFQAIRSEKLISRAAVVAILFQGLRNSLPLFIGVAGRILYEDVSNPENVGVMAILDFFPAWFAGLLLAAVLGAILSTSDSMMIVASADVTRFYEEVINPDASERTVIILGRLVVAAVAILGILLAYIQPGTIFQIIEFAFVGLGVSFGVPLVGVLWWEKVTGSGVLTGILLGLISSLGNLYLLPDYFPILVWPLPILGLIVVSYFTYSKEEVPRDRGRPT